MQISGFYKRLLSTLSSMIILGLTTVSHGMPNQDGIQVYQKNVHLLPSHKQKLADDITRYRNADNLWDVLREEFSLPHYEESYAVQAKIEWYMNNQDYLLRVASRSAPYLYYISQQVRKRRLPAELALLPIVESGYNPFSVSSMGASGLWQLMPDTATSLGVKREWGYDGRRDVIASTRAALNYLAYLQSFFEGNWLLAIAAYNTGEGNVLAAIKRNIRDGKDTDFWSLPVAQETRDYVPSLLALAVIISRPDKYPVYLPPIRNAPYLAQVDVGRQINLKYAAKYAGIDHQRLLTLNPGYNSSSTSSKAPYKIILPIEKVEQFTENLARSSNTQPVDCLHYRVKSGDTLASISRKYRTSVSSIRQMNHLTTASVKPGTNLLIPSSSH
jgi:membrane-bound lytic murein transglycosylase D